MPDEKNDTDARNEMDGVGEFEYFFILLFGIKEKFQSARQIHRKRTTGRFYPFQKRS